MAIDAAGPPRRFVPAPAALATWLAVPLVGAKVVHWSWPGTRWGDWPDWVKDVAVSSHADVAFAAIFGLVAFVLLRLFRRWPRLERGLGIGLLALSAFCAFYAVASIQMFAFLRSPLTYPLLYLAGDLKSMRSSIGSFLSAGFVAALVLVPLGHLVAVWLGSRPGRGPAGSLRRGLRIASLGVISAWVVWGARTADGRWSDRPDLLIAENPHWKLVSSLLDEVRGGAMPRMDDDFPPGHLSDFRPASLAPARVPEPGARATALAALPRTERPRNVLLVVLESTGTRYPDLY
ncbi:MAG: hypothetical protein HY900_12415, partial [Deltaproteobacteria bacterium]|nr:hypothetical protein [Deltaproteobacteria bacterium]